LSESEKGKPVCSFLTVSNLKEPFPLLTPSLFRDKRKPRTMNRDRRYVMAEIKWEKDFEAALERAKKEGKAVFHDFWFDG
jgi:hypothetical protein